MKYHLFYILLIFATVILFSSCSKLNDNIPVEPKINVHPTGFSKPSSPNFHGTYLKDNNWNLKECETCHAANFSGGTTGEACTACHKEPGGPLACNTCHGNPNNINEIAPPRDINGDTATTAPGVGAHSSHLYADSLTNNVECGDCHNVPQSVFSPGHLDSQQPAKVVLKGLATANVASNATFNSSNLTCSNTYCHGNFVFKKDSAAAEDQFAFTDSEMVGNNVTVTWTKVNDGQAACGTCHDLPPKGHIGYQRIPVTECVVCHQGVVDDQGNIIDKDKHINGKVNVRGN